MIKFIIGWYLLNFLVFGIFLIFKIIERMKEKKVEKDILNDYRKY